MVKSEASHRIWFPLRRLTAFFLDYIVILLYGGILFFLSMTLNQTTGYFELFSHPVQAQWIGFITLTLPVFLYFTFFEKSTLQGTPGKRLLKLQVVSVDYNKASLHRLAIRNAIKFLPWEMAHGAVHWSFYYTGQDADIPVFLFLINGTAIALSMVFVLLIFIKKDNRTLYETWSKTRVTVEKQENFNDG